MAYADTSPHLLVVEDDYAVRDTLAMVLRHAGYRVAEAGDGQTALQRITEHVPALVVTDAQMPDLSGWDVAREVKKAHPDVPVILMSGWARVDGRDLKSVDVMLDKPFAIDEFLAAVQDLCPRA